MPSPFPGMDPFLEADWGDVHTSLTTYARDQLNRQLPADLRARVEEYVGVEIEHDEGESDSGQRRPDVSVLERWSPRHVESSLELLDPEIADSPLVVSYSNEPETLRRILIHDRKGERLVTSIEFLSPGNKVGGGRTDFRQKQAELADAGINLVEIDLVRAGGWAVYPLERDIPGSHSEPYRIVVVRATRPKGFECYPAGIRLPLPRIRIPLRAEDRDVVLDLQALLSQAWENGHYSDIDYAHAPLPKFEDSDRQWIREQLSRQGIERLI